MDPYRQTITHAVNVTDSRSAGNKKAYLLMPNIVPHFCHHHHHQSLILHIYMGSRTSVSALISYMKHPTGKAFYAISLQKQHSFLPPLERVTLFSGGTLSYTTPSFWITTNGRWEQVSKLEFLKTNGYHLNPFQMLPW